MVRQLQGKEGDSMIKKHWSEIAWITGAVIVSLYIISCPFAFIYYMNHDELPFLFLLMGGVIVKIVVYGVVIFGIKSIVKMFNKKKD